MEAVIIRPQSYWKHKREGYEVQVGDEEDLRTKDGNDANWQPALCYRRTDLEDSPPFVRPVKDFLAKFVEVSDA